tara:strand:- start:822 stop:1334 length:513 start_codon:yes stop_codon:yes gene_type:complete
MAKEQLVSERELFTQHAYLLLIAVIGVFLIKRETSNSEAVFKYSVFPVLVMLWAFFDAVFNRFFPGDKYVEKEPGSRKQLPRIQLGIFETVIFIMSVYFLKFRYNVGGLLVISYLWMVYLVILGLYHSIYTIADPKLKYTWKTFWRSSVKIVAALFLMHSVREISHKLYN